MGLSYLNGKTWSEVTRDERFFCSHLYNLILNTGVTQFISYLNEKHRTNFSLNTYWEIGYEVCFYRDLWQLRDKKSKLFSRKRTFDLCLFSEETIIIIEAKSDQRFERDQLASFDKDKNQVIIETNVKLVLLLGLVSSKYQIPIEFERIFNGPILTWGELAAFYKDSILQRANDIFNPENALSYGRNNLSGSMTGQQLYNLHVDGKDFYVGRKSGLGGDKLREDITSGSWMKQKYETNDKANERPSENWFLLSEFMKLVEMYRGES